MPYDEWLPRRVNISTNEVRLRGSLLCPTAAFLHITVAAVCAMSHESPTCEIDPIGRSPRRVGAALGFHCGSPPCTVHLEVDEECVTLLLNPPFKPAFCLLQCFCELLCSPLRHEPQHALLFASSEGRKLRCLLFDTARCSCSLFLIVTCHSLLYGRSKFQRRERRKCFVKGLYDARIAHAGHLRIVSASLSNAVLPRFFPNSKSSFSRHARGLTMLVYTSSSI